MNPLRFGASHDFLIFYDTLVELASILPVTFKASRRGHFVVHM